MQRVLREVRDEPGGEAGEEADAERDTEDRRDALGVQAAANASSRNGPIRARSRQLQRARHANHRPSRSHVSVTAQARGARVGVDRVDADVCPAKPVADDVLGLEADDGAPARDTRRLELDEDEAARPQQRREPREQCRRAPADPDVAVEQQRAPPGPGARDVVEDRPVQHGRAARARDADRDRRDVDPERERAAAGEREHVAPGSAADVEDRRDGAREDVAVGAVSGPR